MELISWSWYIRYYLQYKVFSNLLSVKNNNSKTDLQPAYL